MIYEWAANAYATNRHDTGRQAIEAIATKLTALNRGDNQDTVIAMDETRRGGNQRTALKAVR